MWASTRVNLTLLHAKNKGTDHTVQPQSLISAFVVPFLESIIQGLHMLEKYLNLEGFFEKS